MRPAFRFGDFCFDVGRHELRRGTELLRLPPKAFELLGLLLERAPEAVSKAEIRDRIWPRTVVSDASLPRLVNAIRSVLRDDADAPRFVRTLQSFGYAFCGDLKAASKPARLPAAHLVWGKTRFPLNDGSNLIGRDPVAEACIDAATVSRQHARIVLAADTSAIEDLASKNGTWVENKRVVGSRDLAHGDEVRLGEVRIVFERPARAASTRTAADPRRTR